MSTSGDPLSLWREGPTKDAIRRFVAATTTEGSANYVSPADLEVPADALETSDLVLWGIQVLESVPGNDHKLKCLVQVERPHITLDPAHVFEVDALLSGNLEHL